MPATASLEIVGQQRLEEVAAELDAAAVRLKVGITAEMARAAAPLVPKVRAAIAQIPSKDGGRSGLKRAMMAATTVAVRSVGAEDSLAIRVDGRKMPPGQGSLPGYMEGSRKTPWRHPVYGHDWWVEQDAHPFFHKTVDHVPAEVVVTINELARVIMDSIR